jgi:hypothetical protein
VVLEGLQLRMVNPSQCQDDSPAFDIIADPQPKPVHRPIFFSLNQFRTASTLSLGAEYSVRDRDELKSYFREELEQYGEYVRQVVCDVTPGGSGLTKTAWYAGESDTGLRQALHRGACVSFVDFTLYSPPAHVIAIEKKTEEVSSTTMEMPVEAAVGSIDRVHAWVEWHELALNPPTAPAPPEGSGTPLLEVFRPTRTSSKMHPGATCEIAWNVAGRVTNIKIRLFVDTDAKRMTYVSTIRSNYLCSPGLNFVTWTVPRDFVSSNRDYFIVVESLHEAFEGGIARDQSAPFGIANASQKVAL